MSNPSRFLNREISSLSFQARVLEEANNPNNPLLERLKFLSISASNLDEFYMIRVGGLMYRAKDEDDEPGIDGKTATEQLELINARALELMKNQQSCWAALRADLKKQNITLVEKQELSLEETQWLKAHFIASIFPALTPIAIDPAHPFPFLPNLALAIILHLERAAEGYDRKLLGSRDFRGIIPLPASLPRLVRLPDSGQEIRFILLEDVLDIFSSELFPGCKVLESGLVRITRDSDLEAMEEAEDLVSSFETALKKRKRGIIIRLKASSSMAAHLLDFAIQEFAVAPGDVIRIDGLLGISSLAELYLIDRPDLKFPAMNIRFPERISDFDGDCFAAIHAKDIVVHHPYESFDVVVQFLRQAAADPDVVAIKQTLYRTSNDSPIVKALIEAAENGKAVTALVELKARFDEEANIRWARNLERAGAQVIYGFVRLKTHAKVSLIVRKTPEGLQSYVHFGTGNYHPVNAKIYTDLSFFTCDPALCRDAAHLFNYLTGYSPPAVFEKISIAPINLRQNLKSLIADEMAHAKSGKKAAIWLKANSLVDPDIIDDLYRASAAGVSIDLVIRGICCLRPGVKGLSENIRVKSIVGRFLEHSRIFCFGAGYGLPSAKAKVFISSADLMPRNLDWRIEVMVPIENPTVHEQIMSQIMGANLKDENQSWVLQGDGSYSRAEHKKNSFSAHEFFMQNPSLSGRGKALHGKKKASN